MPEIATTSTSDAGSGSSPTSTADIAASVISELGDAALGDNAPVAADAASKPADQNTPVTDPDDFDAVEAETVDSLGRKRINNIPHPRVKTMIARREQKLIAAVAKELGITKAEAELKLEDVIGTVKERGTKFTEYETRVQGIESVEALMVQDPGRFMEMLATLNPTYKEWQKAAAQQQQQQTQSKTDDDPEPEPDYDLGNGQMTYSLDGLRKLRAWERRQAVKEVNTGLEARLKPFEQDRQQREQAEQQRQEFEQRRDQIAQDITQRLAAARKWPQFTEHEKDIRAHMDAERAKGNFVRFEDAYMQVVMPKLAADRTKIRQEVIDESNAQPKTTSTTSTPSAQKQTDRPKTTAEIAAEVIASMK